jgi:hypothetical protein
VGSWEHQQPGYSNPHAPQKPKHLKIETKQQISGYRTDGDEAPSYLYRYAAEYTMDPLANSGPPNQLASVTAPRGPQESAPAPPLPTPPWAPHGPPRIPPPGPPPPFPSPPGPRFIKSGGEPKFDPPRNHSPQSSSSLHSLHATPQLNFLFHPHFIQSPSTHSFQLIRKTSFIPSVCTIRPCRHSQYKSCRLPAFIAKSPSRFPSLLLSTAL